MVNQFAKGRIFPQYYSRDKRYGRLSIKACALYPLIWSNADDQGRLTGDPDEIKYAVCPNIDHLPKSDIPGLLAELSANSLIKVYEINGTKVVQMLDWWKVNIKLQWAYPSEFPPDNGWQDRLRYKQGLRSVVTKNWDISPQFPGFTSAPVVGENHSPEYSGECSPGSSPLPPPIPPPDKEKEKDKDKGKGNIPEVSGIRSPEYSPINSGEVSGELCKLHEHYLGPIGSSQADEIKEFAGRYTGKLEWLEMGFKAAGDKLRWSYVLKILERYNEEGGPNGRARNGRAGEVGGDIAESYRRGGWDVQESA